jgi:hypothetical protein
VEYISHKILGTALLLRKVFFVCVRLGFELRALSTLPVNFALVILEMGSHGLFVQVPMSH